MKNLLLISVLASVFSVSAFAKVSADELARLSNQADMIGRIDAGTMAFDLAKARGQTIPGLPAEELASYQKQRPEMVKSVRAALAKIKASESEGCFLAAAEMTRDVQGEGLAAGLRQVGSVANGLFLPTETESLEYLRVVGGNGVTSLSEKKAVQVCSQ